MLMFIKSRIQKEWSFRICNLQLYLVLIYKFSMIFIIVVLKNILKFGWRFYLENSFVLSSECSISMRLHTSKTKVLHLRLNSRETLQNFLYLYEKKTEVVFSFFVSSNFHFSLYECPGLCQDRPGHSLGGKWKLLKMKNKRNYLIFLFI